MDSANSYLVPYDLVDVPASWWAYTPGATWAEPDVDAAAEVMRRVWEDPDEARALGERARDEMLERFPPSRTADFVERRLDELRATGAIGTRTARHDVRPAILEATQKLAKEPGTVLVEGRASPPTSLVRRLLRRALWPHLEDQQRVDTAVLDTVASLQRSVQRLDERVQALEGGTAGGTRGTLPREPGRAPEPGRRVEDGR
jgi:hypothetical protein